VTDQLGPSRWWVPWNGLSNFCGQESPGVERFREKSKLKCCPCNFSGEPRNPERTFLVCQLGQFFDTVVQGISDDVQHSCSAAVVRIPVAQPSFVRPGGYRGNVCDRVVGNV
jgi:hypothetical protein